MTRARAQPIPIPATESAVRRAFLPTLRSAYLEDRNPIVQSLNARAGSSLAALAAGQMEAMTEVTMTAAIVRPTSEGTSRG
jgi:hypothetical protein